MSIKTDYNKYLKSDYWKEVKEKIHKRDDYKCRLCNSDEDLHVHHRSYEFLGNENLDDLITLCRSCHYIFHKKNPQHNYSTYIKNKEWEIIKKQEEKEFIDIWFYISNNREIFNDLKTRLINYKYIKCSDFHKIIKKLNKPKFDNILFINICLEYINGIGISSYYNKNAKDILDLPKRSCDIILNRDIYDKYEQWFNRFHYGKL